MNKICRVCLEEGVLSSIFIKNYNISISDMVEYCTNIRISRDDGLPDQMCSNCMYKLGIAYHFKQTCESADLRLRQYLGLRVPEKATDAAVMTDPIVVHQTIIKKCKCKQSVTKKSSTNYKRKPESEKQKRGPKPKPKQIHSCYECAKEFRCQAQLDMHISHFRVRPYKTSTTHTGVKPFACMYCKRSFVQKHNLTIHMRIHTGERPFQCEVCSKRFAAQGNLQAHLKIHTGQRDHVCSLCNKSFITSSELTRHIGKHRGVKNFKCDLCGSAYSNARNLRLHKLKKHHVNLQNSKLQNEAYNNSNIDIIGVDVEKETSIQQIPVKDNHHIAHLISVKTDNVPEQSQSLLSYENKEHKELYHLHHEYSNKEIDPCQSCTVFSMTKAYGHNENEC